MKVFRFNSPEKVRGPEVNGFIYSSLMEGGISRFGWSYVDSADLKQLIQKNWNELNDAEKNCFKKANFLLNVEKDDWVVHVNIPGYGKCTAGKVVEGYKFDTNQNKFNDFRHTLTLDKSSIITFDRNDQNVLPNTSAKLKFQGSRAVMYKINEIDEFNQSIKNLKNNSVAIGNDTKEVYYLKKDIKPHLAEITKLIHKNHNKKDLESFIADIFRNMPNVTGVKENGSGYKSDYGADLIVYYSTGLPFDELEDGILVVQIRSYEGTHAETEVVKLIKTAIEKFNANAGLIISTASEVSENLSKSIEDAELELKKPIGLICGEEVAIFALKYGADLLRND